MSADKNDLPAAYLIFTSNAQFKRLKSLYQAIFSGEYRQDIILNQTTHLILEGARHEIGYLIIHLTFRRI